jgi:hypothetical protein
VTAFAQQQLEKTCVGKSKKEKRAPRQQHIGEKYSFSFHLGTCSNPFPDYDLSKMQLTSNCDF